MTGGEAGKKLKARGMWVDGAGKAELARVLGVSKAQVERWAREEGWGRLRQRWWAEPRGAAAVLRRLLARKVERMVAVGEPELKEVEELAKIAAALGKLERTGYDLRAAAVEVCERLAGYAAAAGADEAQLEWLAGLLEGFFASLEEG